MDDNHQAEKYIAEGVIVGVNTQMLMKNIYVIQEVTSGKGIQTPPPPKFLSYCFIMILFQYGYLIYVFIYDFHSGSLTFSGLLEPNYRLLLPTLITREVKESLVVDEVEV